MKWIALLALIGWFLYGTEYFVCFQVFICLILFGFIALLFFKATENLGKKNKLHMISTDGIDTMTGVEFENWCVRLLFYLGAKNIRTTKGSGDQGVDIIADIDGVSYAVQCKRYSKPLGNKPIQEVYAGMQYYGCIAGAVMTNQTFTAGGKSLAQSTGIELWDRQWLESAASRTTVKIEEPKMKRTKTAYIYSEGGEKKIEDGKWPHQYAKEIEIDFFRTLQGIGHPEFDVIGKPRFPKCDPRTINRDSIITLETEPFEKKDDAYFFAKYAEKHFYAKVWVENVNGKYITVIQTHVYSIEANYREEDGLFEL